MTDNLRVEKERKYWDKLAPKYDRFIDKNWKIYPPLLDRISSDVNVGDVVLDVATGTGLVSFKVAQRAKHVYAVDFSPPFIDEANRKVKETGIGNVEFSLEDVCSLSFDKDMFDVVICVNSLHFIRDPQQALSEMKRVLKPGGRLIAPTPCIKESPKVRLMMRFYKFFTGMSVCHCFSIEDLLNLIKEFGFDIVKKEIIRHPRDILSMVYIVGDRR